MCRDFVNINSLLFLQLISSQSDRADFCLSAFQSVSPLTGVILIDNLLNFKAVSKGEQDLHQIHMFIQSEMCHILRHPHDSEEESEIILPTNRLNAKGVQRMIHCYPLILR
jgi:hypothetical protein